MIKISAENIKNAQKMLEIAPKEVTSAAVAAINRAATAVNTQVSKSIRERYVIKAKDLNRHIKKYRANRSTLTAKIIGTSDRLLITYFDVKRGKKGKGPIRARVLKASSLKAVPGMFFGTTKRGFTGVLKRIGKARYPLDVPHGPSVPSMFGNNDVMKEVTAIADETLNERFEHEINHRFSKIWSE